MSENKSWTVIPIMDGDDMIVELPDELLKQLDWREGDSIEYDISDGKCIVKNKTADERKNGTSSNPPK